VGPRLKLDREEFPPNNLLVALIGAGILWLGWTGFNGGDPFSANVDSSVAVLNTHICATTSILVWVCLDFAFSGKPTSLGAIQGMITGLVCITPAAGRIHSIFADFHLLIVNMTTVAYFCSIRLVLL
jgi:ammonium transporter, Amt family